MERFVKGEVVVIPFSYTDLSATKKRPALVIATLRGENIILAQITTVKREDEDLISLTKKDFQSGFLKQDSFIMPSIISTAESSTVAYKVGKIKQEKIKEVEKKLCDIFIRWKTLNANENEEETSLEIREKYQHGTSLTLEEDLYNELFNLAKVVISKTKEIVEQ